MTMPRRHRYSWDHYGNFSDDAEDLSSRRIDTSLSNADDDSLETINAGDPRGFWTPPHVAFRPPEIHTVIDLPDRADLAGRAFGDDIGIELGRADREGLIGEYGNLGGGLDLGNGWDSAIDRLRPGVTFGGIDRVSSSAPRPDGRAGWWYRIDNSKTGLGSAGTSTWVHQTNGTTDAVRRTPPPGWKPQAGKQQAGDLNGVGTPAERASAALSGANTGATSAAVQGVVNSGAKKPRPNPVSDPVTPPMGPGSVEDRRRLREFQPPNPSTNPDHRVWGESNATTGLGTEALALERYHGVTDPVPYDDDPRKVYVGRVKTPTHATDETGAGWGGEAFDTSLANED